MTVVELIRILSDMPPNMKVFHIWDGEPRTEINFVWLSKKGVITADSGEVVYDKDARPDWADDSEYWNTPENGGAHKWNGLNAPR